MAYKKNAVSKKSAKRKPKAEKPFNMVFDANKSVDALVNGVSLNTLSKVTGLIVKRMPAKGLKTLFNQVIRRMGDEAAKERSKHISYTGDV